MGGAARLRCVRPPPSSCGATRSNIGVPAGWLVACRAGQAAKMVHFPKAMVCREGQAVLWGAGVHGACASALRQSSCAQHFCTYAARTRCGCARVPSDTQSSCACTTNSFLTFSTTSLLVNSNHSPQITCAAVHYHILLLLALHGEQLVCWCGGVTSWGTNF